jgi:hypothetical protein
MKVAGVWVNAGVLAPFPIKDWRSNSCVEDDISNALVFLSGNPNLISKIGCVVLCPAQI